MKIHKTQKTEKPLKIQNPYQQPKNLYINYKAYGRLSYTKSSLKVFFLPE